ncbi:hypothetical protein M1446_04710 [Candidatus Dependentiae bacterium]|nr:hypothetical protein [Candidatus Dependentiae bacterium]
MISKYYYFASLFITFFAFGSKQQFLAILRTLKNDKYIHANFKNLEEAIDIFHATPQFNLLIQKLQIFSSSQDQRNLRGLIYEIVEGLKLAKEKNVPTKFECVLADPSSNLHRILDCGNNTHYWEMKNVYWLAVEKNTYLKDKFEKQILEEKKLAEIHGCHFQVRSNHKFTSELKKFLRKYNIDYKDNTKSFQEEA